MKANGRHHDASTKHHARRINRQDRRVARLVIRKGDVDAILNYQPRGRAIWDCI